MDHCGQLLFKEFRRKEENSVITYYTVPLFTWHPVRCRADSKNPSPCRFESIHGGANWTTTSNLNVISQTACCESSIKMLKSLLVCAIFSNTLTPSIEEAFPWPHSTTQINNYFQCKFTSNLGSKISSCKSTCVIKPIAWAVIRSAICCVSNKNTEPITQTTAKN